MGKGNQDTSAAEYNANEAITRRIDQLTNDSINALSVLRVDGSNATRTLDLLKNWWDEIYPVASIKGNTRFCQGEVDEVQSLMAELYSMSNREVRRSSVFGQVRGASTTFMTKIHRLKSLIQVCGQRFGFGMTVKSFGNYDSDSSIRRALD